MGSIIELMLAINNRSEYFFYHKDTNTFDRLLVSAIEMICGDIYEQLFLEWAEEKKLNFK